MIYYNIKHKVPHIPFNTLMKVDRNGSVDWHMEDTSFSHNSLGHDRYFTKEEINNLPDDLKRFIQSEFCEVTRV